jgi:hypothetical protein
MRNSYQGGFPRTLLNSSLNSAATRRWDEVTDLGPFAMTAKERKQQQFGGKIK